MDPAVQNTLNRISNWVDHAGPAIDNLPPAAPLTLLAVVAFNNTIDALPVPAIDPLRIENLCYHQITHFLTRLPFSLTVTTRP